MRRQILASALLSLAAGLALPAAAPAADAELVVVPHAAQVPGLSYLKLDADPGESVEAGTIELIDRGSASAHVELTPVDGETLSTFGSSYRPPGSNAHGSTRWMRLDARTLTLAPDEHALVTVRVDVPHGVAPGDYLSGVSIEQLDQAPRTHTAHGLTAASTVRYAIGVETTVPGHRRRRIELTGAGLQQRPGGLEFLLKARNSGNTILSGVHGAVRIEHDGHVVLHRAIPPGTFLAGSSIAYPVPAQHEHPSAGTRFRVKATLVYQGGVAHLDTNVTFGKKAAKLETLYGHRRDGGGGMPWWQAALIALLILYALVATVLLTRRSRWPGGELGASR